MVCSLQHTLLPERQPQGAYRRPSEEDSECAPPPCLPAHPTHTQYDLLLNSMLWNFKGWSTVAMYSGEAKGTSSYTVGLAAGAVGVIAVYVLPLLSGLSVEPDTSKWTTGYLVHVAKAQSAGMGYWTLGVASLSALFLGMNGMASAARAYQSAANHFMMPPVFRCVGVGAGGCVHECVRLCVCRSVAARPCALRVPHRTTRRTRGGAPHPAPPPPPPHEVTGHVHSWCSVRAPRPCNGSMVTGCVHRACCPAPTAVAALSQVEPEAVRDPGARNPVLNPRGRGPDEL